MNFLPCCCGGCAASPGPVKRFINATKVSAYPGSTGTIDVYPRVYYTVCACSPASSTCGGTAEPVCYTHGYDLTIPVNEWTVPGVFAPDATGGELVSQVVDNYFKHDGTTMLTYPTHCTYGWKAVLAKSIWQGRFGFVDSGGACCPTGGTEQIKYRTATESAICVVADSWVRKDCAGVTTQTGQRNYSSNCSQTSSVDDYGNITRAGTVSIIKDYDDTGTPDSGNFNSCEVGDSYGVVGKSLLDSFQELHTESYPAAGFSFDAACGIISWNGYTGTKAELDALALYTPTADFYTSHGACTANTAYTELVQIDSEAAVFEITNTTLKVTFKHIGTHTTIPCCDDPFAADTSEYIFNRTYIHTIDLGGEVAYSDVVADAEFLLGEWDMTKDDIYPWRHDTSTWLVPLVSRDAGLRSPVIDWGHVEGTCIFVNEIHFSGDVRGSPMPAGYGYYFNFYHRQWCVQSPACDDACESYLGEMGDAPLPYSSTQWPETRDGSDSRGAGAHLYNIVGGQFGGAPTPGEVVYAQKWAETLTQWPAINFSRACGRDRYLYNEPTFVCGTLVGTNLTLDTSATLSGKVVILDGVYLITGGSGTAYTVGARLYDALVTCDGVAALRFSTARAICSTLVATAVQTSPGLVTVTASSDHWLKRGGSESDTVTFTGIGGLTTAVATVTSDTVFTVSGTLTTSPSTGTISDGASAAQVAFDTTCSRNTFIARSWQSDFGNPGDPWSVTETQASLAPITAHPSVLYCTPNGEAFEHGYQIEWGSIASDMCDGTAWSARFEQAIVDPFWQADHVPCGGGAWSQNLIPCEAADATHYAFPPLVEPLITAPVGAPTLSVTFWTAEAQAIPGAVGHAYCSIDPTETGFPMSWREAWLTCETWKELVGFKCG